MAFANPFRNRTDMPAGRTAVRRREMPIVRLDEARHYANVALIPCQHAGCACEGKGASQVAHSNALGDGKGRSLKAPWWMVAAMCPLAHVAIDSGKDMKKAERRAAWVAAFVATTNELFARGLVRPAE